MAQIRCPQCGQVENWDLGGSFLVTCDRCGQQFTVVIAGQASQPGGKSRKQPLGIGPGGCPFTTYFTWGRRRRKKSRRTFQWPPQGPR